MKLAAAICAGGVALTVWGWGVVHRPLAPLAERELRRLSGSGDVSVGGARLAGLGVELSDVRVGPLHARRARMGLDRRRVLLSGVEVRQFAAGELALDLDHGHIKRAAFSGGRWRTLDGLAGVALRENGGFSVRAARPGLLVSGQLSPERAEARVELERLPLDGLLPAGLDGKSATASGALEVRRSGGRWLLGGHLAVDELAVEHRAVSHRRLEHLQPRLEGELAFADGSFASEGLKFSLGPLWVDLSGHAGTESFDVTARLPALSCAEALAALRPILPALDGMVLDGQLSAGAHVSGARDKLGELRLDLDVTPACRVLKDAPLADLAALRGDAPVRRDWTRLANLPEPVVRAFLAAEDGKFFRHHGFDADMIRHALAHDLAARRVEKGASTITQQLMKNLFLSGERTAARKLEEAVLAWRAEQILDKRRILELYLNVVELAPGGFGIAEGAERYFGKEPDQLTSDEAAQLAALLPAPRRGMDAAWEKRYGALKARLPFEKVPLQAPPIQLTRR